MAHHNDAVHGVDPLKDSVEQGKCMVVFFLVLYKAKIALTSFVLKVRIPVVAPLWLFSSRRGVDFALPRQALAPQV